MLPLDYQVHQVLSQEDVQWLHHTLDSQLYMLLPLVVSKPLLTDELFGAMIHKGLVFEILLVIFKLMFTEAPD